MFTTFLNKSDRQKLMLFQYLENAVSLSETKETLMEKLNKSDFLINKLVKELNDDFYELGLNEEFELVTDGTLIKLNESGLANSDTLLTHYLSKALKYSMLKDCFFGQLSSLYEFASNHFLSHNPVYQEFKQFKLILQEYNIEVTKEFQLVGNEHEVREFLFLFFMKEYYLDRSLFPKEIQELCKTFERFNQRSWLKADQSARMRIRKKQYLSIILTRIRTGHYLKKAGDRELVPSEYLLIIEELSSWLREVTMTNDQKILEQEAQALLRFLIVEGWLINNERYIGPTQVAIKKLNDQFTVALSQQLLVSESSIGMLSKELSNIHYQVLSFPFSSRYEYQNLDVTYFLENYPEYVAFCRNYIEKNRKKLYLWDNKEFLFFRYLILLVSTISLKDTLEPLYICVDFSFGRSYNKMIKKNIEKLLDLNIQFQNYPDDHTHLILSNLPFYGALGVNHILWLAPPRPIDWANFTEKVLSIRRKQFQNEADHG